MAIHIGYLRAGWLGLITAGACFIAPAMLIVIILAAIYARYGTTPQVEWLLYGIKPVVIAIIIQALWSLGQKAIQGWLTGITTVAVLLLYFLGINEIALLFGGGLIVMLAMKYKRCARGGWPRLISNAAG